MSQPNMIVSLSTLADLRARLQTRFGDHKYDLDDIDAMFLALDLPIHDMKLPANWTDDIPQRARDKWFLAVNDGLASYIEENRDDIIHDAFYATIKYNKSVLLDTIDIIDFYKKCTT